jgi:DNA sulfur modification protein DndE
MDTLATAPELGLDQIATAAFRGTAEADGVAQRLKDLLGFGAFNIPARLAIARSLAIADMPAPASGEAGRVIKGDTLFGAGADLAAWVSLVIEHAGRTPGDLAEFQGWVRAHWACGMKQLDSLMEEAGSDSGEFWRIIAEGALPTGDRIILLRPDGGGGVPLATVPISVSVGEIGQDVSTGEKIVWPLNAPGGSPHAAFMGGVGSGKTRTAASMLRAIRTLAPVPLVAFDFKGDLSDDNNRLDRAFGARVLNPPQQPIPLDVLAIGDRSPTGITLAAQRLRDSLSTLKGGGFGAIQRDLLSDAAEQALKNHVPCKLSDIRDALIGVYSDRGKKEDGAISTLRDLSRFVLFEPEFSPAQFFERSWIIRLTADLPDLVKVSIMTLVTDALDRFLNAQNDAPTDDNGNRALRVIAMIDEANRILGSKLPGLSGLIRLSRAKGGSIILISQSPDDFSGVDDEFLDQMGLVVAFRTNADPGAVRRILGANANLAALERGQAWTKMGGEAAARRVLTWR